MSNDKDVKSKKNADKQKSQPNIFVYIVISLIIFTFLIVGGVDKGIRQFIQGFGKEIIENPDGTISIESEAQISQNRDRQGTYVGKVLNEKIQLGRDDDFNQQVSWYLQNREQNPFQKYQYVRQLFNQTVNKIIGMHNARKMKLHISRNTLIREIGKRRYNQEGDVNYEAMREDQTKVNLVSKQVLQDLLYENFVFDYFKGLPISEDEVVFNYKLDQVTIAVDYINIDNETIDNDKLDQFFQSNSQNYRLFKLKKMVFKDKEEKAAEEALNKLKDNPAQFDEIGTELKDNEKVINITSDNQFKLLEHEDFEDNKTWQEVLAATGKGKVGSQVIQTSLGPILFYVEDIQEGTIENNSVLNQVRQDYLAKNSESIKQENKQKAEQIYQLIENEPETGFEQVAANFQLEKQNAEAITFNSYQIPHINPDLTDDLNFMVRLFKVEPNTVLKPFAHEKGFMVVQLKERKNVTREEIDNSIDRLTRQYLIEKSNHLKEDFYTEERKRYRVVDNFNFVARELFFSAPLAEE